MTQLAATNAPTAIWREQLADVRTYRGLTWQDVDTRAGLPDGTCAAYESMVTEGLWAAMLARTAVLLGAPASELISPTGSAADCIEGQCGPQLRQSRRAYGLAAAQVASHCGITLPAYLEFERGDTAMESQAPTLLRLADALDVPLYDLIEPFQPRGIRA